MDDHLTTASVTWGAGPIGLGVGLRKHSTKRATVIDGFGAPRITLEGPGPSGGDFAAFLWTELSVNASPRIVAAAPVSAVLTGVFDMTNRTAALTLNATTTVQRAAASGSGAFATGVCTIGRRQGGAQYLDGRLFGLVAIGGAMTGAETAQLTAWLNHRTGAY